MADTNRDKFDGSLAALRGFLECYEGSEECGMVLSHGVYEKGPVNGTKFIAEAKKLGKRVRQYGKTGAHGGCPGADLFSVPERCHSR